MAKVRIADIVRATGLSRATVDRVLNARGRVHSRTVEAVERAMKQLSNRNVVIRDDNDVPIDILMRLGSGMARQMRETFEFVRGPNDRYFDLFEEDEEGVLRHLRAICSDTTRAAIVCVKDTDRVRATLIKARNSGKKIVAAISDLAPEARDSFVGIDNKAAGSTAVALITQAIGDRPATVGVVVGDSAFACHEEREISFRTTLRQTSRKVVLAAEAIGNDNAELTYRGVRKMLEAHPGIGAIYNCSGGNGGLARALMEMERDQDVLWIAHEITFVSVPLLMNGTMNFVLSQNPTELLETAMKAARLPRGAAADARSLIDFGVYTKFNLPSYGRDLHLENMQAP